MRYGLSLIKIYKAALKSGVYKNADSFWQSVQGDAAKRNVFPIKTRNRHHYNSGQTRKSDNYRSPDLSPTIGCDSLHAYAFDVGRGVVSKIMRPMNVTRNKLSQLKQEAAGAVREAKFVSPYFPSYKFDGQDDDYSVASSDTSKRVKKESIVPTISIAESVASYSSVLTGHLFLIIIDIFLDLCLSG
jgi:hypothetical protein